MHQTDKAKEQNCPPSEQLEIDFLYNERWQGEDSNICSDNLHENKSSWT